MASLCAAPALASRPPALLRLVVLLLVPLAAAQTWRCPHCDVGPGFEELLKPEKPKQEGAFASTVHATFLTHIERFNLTRDIGGWLPESLHRNLAAEIIKGWRGFFRQASEELPRDHPLAIPPGLDDPGALNNKFFRWQKDFFEQGVDTDDTTWPELNAVPEYQKFRQVVNKVSRRYLERSGMSRKVAQSLNMSIFNWAAVHGPGEFHSPHTHVGEFLAGVFYVQVAEGAGKILFRDPRGINPPFGKEMEHSPRSGEMILFPSWLSHMVTVSHPRHTIAAGEEPLRVVISFNVGPLEGPLPCANFYSDPTAEMGFQRTSPIDLEELGLL